MDLETTIKKSRSRIENIKSIGTEAATKSSLIEPLIRALGYDTSDIDEVCPEYTADFGVKKGEKIDYAILKDGAPIMLIECKTASEELKEKYEGQLHRYFTSIVSRDKVTCKIAILTNGIRYKFFSDFDKPNVLDKRPFFEIDVENATQEHIAVLKKFSKPDFNLDELMSEGKNMLMMGNIASILSAEMESPSDEFIRMVCSRCYDGNLTQRIVNEYKPLIKKSFNQMITERVDSGLMAAIEQTRKKPETNEPELPAEVSKNNEPTEEEIIGFNIVKAICITLIPADRIFMRKVESYCTVILDNTNRKPLLRMYFNNINKKYVTTIDADKKEVKMAIDIVPEISKAKEQIRATLRSYLGSKNEE